MLQFRIMLLLILASLAACSGGSDKGSEGLVLGDGDSTTVTDDGDTDSDTDSDGDLSDIDLDADPKKDEEDTGKVGDYDDLPVSVQNLLAEIEKQSSTREYWKKGFNHSNSLLEDVGKSLKILSNRSDINDLGVELLLDYIRAYTQATFYNGDYKNYKETEAVSKALSEGLQAFVKLDGFMDITTRTGNLHYQFAMVLQGRLFAKYASYDQYLQNDLEVMLSILELYAKESDKIWGRFSFKGALERTLQVIKMAGQYEESKALKQFFDNDMSRLFEVLEKIGKSKLIFWKEGEDKFNPIIFKRLAMAFAQPYYFYRWAPGAGESVAKGTLENADSTLLRVLKFHKLKIGNNHYPAAFLSATAAEVANGYITNTERDAAELCKNGDFSPYCNAKSIDEVFEQAYQCPRNASVKMRAQKGGVSQENKDKICDELKAQEDYFKQKTGQYQSVEDDNNDVLELIIFTDKEQYGTYGNTFFEIPTNNGGYYLERDPNKVDNQANFYAYVKPTKDGKFRVWNLRHEFTHYLDGRYVTYGAWGRFSEKTVWWSEGIAEFMAHKECFARGLNSIYSSSSQPSLSEILNVEYGQGSDLIYHWSYAVHRYLNENGLTSTWNQMIDARRNPDKQQAVKDYNVQVEYLINSHSTGFSNWIDTSLKDWWENEYTDLCEGKDDSRSMRRSRSEVEAHTH